MLEERNRPINSLGNYRSPRSSIVKKCCNARWIVRASVRDVHLSRHSGHNSAATREISRNGVEFMISVPANADRSPKQSYSAARGLKKKLLALCIKRRCFRSARDNYCVIIHLVIHLSRVFSYRSRQVCRGS